MRSPRARHAIVGVLLALAALYLVALAAARSAPAERLLRARIQGALRARLGEVKVGDALTVDPLFRVAFGPVELGSGDGAPVVSIARARVRPSLPALLRGRAEPAAIRLDDVRIAPGPEGRDLRALLARLRSRRDGRGSAEGNALEPGALPSLTVRHLVVTLPFRGAPLVAGPFDAKLSTGRDSGGPILRAEATLPGGGRASLAMTLGKEAWRARLRAAGIGPDALPSALRPRAASIAAGALSLVMEAEASPDLSRASATLRGEVDGVFIEGDLVSQEPVGPLAGSASARLEWDGRARRLTVRDGEAALLGSIPLVFTGELSARPPASFALDVRAERVEYRAVLASLPAPLSLPPEAARPPGTFGGRLELSGPLLVPAEWKVSAALDLAALREAARRSGPSSLAAPFSHRPFLDGGGRGPELRIGPASPNFVPIGELPEYVARAVTSAEDGGFFAHAGFDFDELRNAAVQGAERGRVVRGGSTITQQLAKNLYLGGERTLARKVREAALAVGLEATLSKRRILEIYLNVAEWGPGLWGIGPAARHWFGKDARALTPKEAAFLASIIPSPLRSHAMFERGVPTEARDARVRDLLFRMAEQGALSDTELASALLEPLIFASAAPSALPAVIAPAGGELPRPVPLPPP